MAFVIAHVLYWSLYSSIYKFPHYISSFPSESL